MSVTPAHRVEHPLEIRAVLGRKAWGVPERYGPDGWRLESRALLGSVIVSRAAWDVEWVHASIAYADRLPDYQALVRLHAAVYGDGYAYQAFVPAAEHVNLHPYALHLWGRADGAPVLPRFGAGGTI